MPTRQHRRLEAHKALLNLFTDVTGLPIGLYESENGELKLTLSDESQAKFEDHCQFIRQFPEGEKRCNDDQCRRALSTFNTQQPELTLCYAGLYNQATPLITGREMRGVLIYGEMLLEGEDFLANSLENHEKAVNELALSAEDAAKLREKLLASKKISADRLKDLSQLLPKIEQWFYTLMDEEDRQVRDMDQVTHDMQTRLQAVIANAENLVAELPSLSPEDAHHNAQTLFLSVLALDTLIQNLGHYLEDYKFQRYSLADIVDEATNVYEAEAARRGIEIRVNLEGVQQHLMEVSRAHLQHAINNLIHNAVKYSFRSGPGRQRFVKVTGQPMERYYALEIINYGVGIQRDEIMEGKIFEDGYQGNLTQGEYRTGSGRGLSFVKGVIDEHHGYIEVESLLVADDGSPEGRPHLNRFTIYLPYVQP